LEASETGKKKVEGGMGKLEAEAKPFRTAEVTP
jgi:hypothetical protein